MKQYKEKLEEAKKLYESANNDQKYVLESLFPELKESEDERIKRELCKAIWTYIPNEEAHEYIAWLEKQKTTDVLDKEEREFADNVDSYRKDMDEFYKKGYNAGREAEKQYWLEKQVEQKSADNVEPKFKVGDWAVSDLDGIARQISEVHFDEYNSYYVVDGKSVNLEEYDRLHHLWTITDAKDGDMLYHSDTASNGIFIFKELFEYEFGEKVICYCDYDSEDGFCLGKSHTCCWADAKILHPATKEQRDLLFQKMKEAGYEWVSENKKLRKGK